VSSAGGSGHFGPLVPSIHALAGRGDEVLIAVPAVLAERVASMGHLPLLVDDPPAEEVAAIWDQMPLLPKREASALFNREVFGRLNTEARLPVIERALDEWRPDLVLHEAAEYASAIAATRAGVPHAQVAIGQAGVEAGSLDLAAPALAVHGQSVVREIRRSPYLTRLPASLDPSPYQDTRRFREVLIEPSAPLPD